VAAQVAFAAGSFDWLTMILLTAKCHLSLNIDIVYILQPTEWVGRSWAGRLASLRGGGAGDMFLTSWQDKIRLATHYAGLSSRH
jgi:hypothetical protein